MRLNCILDDLFRDTPTWPYVARWNTSTNTAEYSQIQPSTIDMVFYIYSWMRYPFKDQAKSSSETLIPVDLSPPCPLFGTKFYPILKEKVFNSKSKLPQLNITTKRRRPLWGEKEKATTKILLLRNCGHSRNCFFRKSVVRPAGGQRRDTNQQIIRMLGEIFSSNWYYLNIELMQHIIGLIYSWHLSWTKRKASLQAQTQKYLFYSIKLTFPFVHVAIQITPFPFYSQCTHSIWSFFMAPIQRLHHIYFSTKL